MTDPEVGRLTFAAVVGHEPTPEELARVLLVRQRHLPRAVAESAGYRVLPGVRERLDQLHADGCLLGPTTRGTEAAPHHKPPPPHPHHHLPFCGHAPRPPPPTPLPPRGARRAPPGRG